MLTLLTFLPCLSLVAQGTSAGASPQAVLAPIEDVLTQAKSVEFSVTCDVVKTEVFRALRKQPPGPDTGLEVQLKFIGEADKYYFTEALVDPVKNTTTMTERAFDGARFQDLDHATGALLMSKSDVLGHHLRLGFYSPLHMFGFLRGVLPGPQATISWSGITNPAFWQKLLVGAEYLGEQDYAGKPCAVLKIDGGMNRLFDVPCTFTVYLSKTDGYFPVAWKSEDLKGRILEDYQVDEFGKIPVGSAYFYYPIKATDRCYTAQGFPAGSPQTITTIKTSSFKLNEADQSAFMIDPTKARMIVDQDNDVAVTVPK